jgi:hypothetical protein
LGRTLTRLLPRTIQRQQSATVKETERKKGNLDFLQ